MNGIKDYINEVYAKNDYKTKFSFLSICFSDKDYDNYVYYAGQILAGICKAVTLEKRRIYNCIINRDEILTCIYDVLETYLDGSYLSRFKNLLLDEVLVTENVRDEDKNDDYIREVTYFINDVIDALNKYYEVKSFDIFKINFYKKSYTASKKSGSGYSSSTSGKKYYSGSGKYNDGCISADATFTRGLGAVDKGIIFKKKFFNLRLDLNISNPDDYKIKSIKLIVKFADKSVGDVVVVLDKQDKIIKDVSLPFEDFKKGIKAFVEIEYKLDLFKSKTLQLNLN